MDNKNEWFYKLEEAFMKIGCFTCKDRKPNSDGYIPIGKTLVHRYMYEMFFGKKVSGRVVRHLCDNPECINPFHLKTGTHADNVKDRVDRDRSAIGQFNGRAKLTPEKVKNIRRNNTNTISEIAENYGVSRRLVQLIKDKKIWKHI